MIVGLFVFNNSQYGLTDCAKIMFSSEMKKEKLGLKMSQIMKSRLGKTWREIIEIRIEKILLQMYDNIFVRM